MEKRSDDQHDVSTSVNGSVSSAASITHPIGGTPAGDVSQERGRKRFEGIVVKEDRTWTVALSDLYIAALKAPILKFSIGIFLTPALLSLLFVPLYLLDLRGFEFEDGILPETPNPCNPLKSSDWLRGRPLCGQNTGWVVAYSVCCLFLYSLSLSTMFGGAPVQARSRYTLLVANLQTLVAQFAFVFLSGAVFSRLSQRSQPIRCARKAVLKLDDVTEEDTDESERFRVFATRLVLKGPMPCVLVDVRIKLAFRIFVQQRDGSYFCSTAGLDLVRPEVAYLEYGIMIKHVIDRNSPLYGHTEESLLAGDASFSLTVIGTERASLLSMFHMQDYFMSDSDIVWDGDFYNFVSVDSRGIRTVDHSQLDTINVFRAAAHVPQAITRMQGLVRETEAKAWIRARQQEATIIEGGSSSKRMDDWEPSQSVNEPEACEGEDIHFSISSQEEARGSGKNIRGEHAGETGGEAMHQELSGTVTSDTQENELLMEKENDPTGGLAGPYVGSSPGAGSSRGLTEEDLQGLRQRKIDREVREGRSQRELGGQGAREGAWMKAHRYNAGF